MCRREGKPKFQQEKKKMTITGKTYISQNLLKMMMNVSAWTHNIESFLHITGKPFYRGGNEHIAKQNGSHRDTDVYSDG